MSVSKPHLDDEQIIDAYYGDPQATGHLSACAECRERVGRLREVLDAFHQYPIPQRGPEHGSVVWTALLPKLPADPVRHSWLRWWIAMPALAALLTVAFLTGRFTQKPSAGISEGISETARERVLLMSLSDHLAQSQIVLSNVVNASPGSSDLERERDRAHELIGANRLLRQTATRLGDLTDAALLEELERALLDFANGHDRFMPADLERTRGLLFKVRVGSVASRERGEKL